MNELSQVTVVWNDCEIGYGEGESVAYAKMEARQSVDSIYADVMGEWKYIVVA